jgi:hypothetical protein
MNAWVERADGTIEIPEQPRVEQWSDGSAELVWLGDGPILMTDDTIVLVLPYEAK